MSKHPDIKKYRKIKQIDRIAEGTMFKMENLHNIQRCLTNNMQRSSAITDQMQMPIVNLYNPLKEKIVTQPVNENHYGGYYVLHNVQKEYG